MSIDPNAFLMGGGIASAKFKEIGDTVKGVIADQPELRQQTDFKTGAPKYWNDGKPMMQLVVTLSTDERDPADPEDDGSRRVYIKGKLQQAVAQAVRKVGAKGLEVGGTLQVSYVGNDAPKVRGEDGAKLYTAEYIAAAPQSQAAFLGTSAAAPAPASAQAPPVQPTSAAAAALGNLTPEQIQQLLAAQQQAGHAQPVAAPF